MANRISIPTKESSFASYYFSDWLRNKRAENKISQEKLGVYLDIDRKSLMAYESGERIPKLDVVAKIFAFFGEDEIKIKLN